MDTSKADTGSSAIIISGSVAKALAIPILCLWPPENSCGYLFDCSADRPTLSNNQCTFSIFSDSFKLELMSSDSLIISFTSILGFKDEYGSWKIIWICLRYLFISLFLRFRISTFSLPRSKYICPSISTSGAVSLRTFKIALPTVDFPEPDSPTIPKVSPLIKSKLTFLTA